MKKPYSALVLFAGVFLLVSCNTSPDPTTSSSCSSSGEPVQKSKYRQDIENISKKIDEMPDSLVNRRHKNNKANRKNAVDKEWLEGLTERAGPSKQYEKYDPLTHLAEASYLREYSLLIGIAKANKDDCLNNCTTINTPFDDFCRDSIFQRIRLDPTTGEYIFDVIEMETDIIYTLRSSIDENDKAHVIYEMYQVDGNISSYRFIDYKEDDCMVYDYMSSKLDTSGECEEHYNVMAYVNLKKECEIVSVSNRYKVHKQTGEITKEQRDVVNYVFKKGDYYCVFSPGFGSVLTTGEDRIRVYNNKCKNIYSMYYSDQEGYDPHYSPTTGLTLNIYETIGGWDSIFCSQKFNDNRFALKVNGEIIKFDNASWCSKAILDYNEGVAEIPMFQTRIYNYKDEIESYNLQLKYDVDLVEQYKDFKATVKQIKMFDYDYESLVSNYDAYDQYFAHEVKTYAEEKEILASFRGEQIPIDLE